MPRTRARAATIRLAPVLGATLFAAGGWGPALGEPPDEHLRGPAQDPPTSAPELAPEPPESEFEDPFALPPPKDPDDSPFMPAPHNQLGTWSAGRVRPLTRGFDDDHRVMLSVVPTYAAIHVPFIGRGDAPLRGGGIALEFDVRMLRWLFVRVFGSHTIHPVFEEHAVKPETSEVMLVAKGGLVQASNTGGSIVYALDIGRFVPRVDVGAGLLFVRSPQAAQAGQWGGTCREGGVCDLGLSCSAEQVCRPAPYPEFHAGLGLDVLIGQRWAFGLAFRYYALLSAISQLPIYLHGSIRLSARF